jgi:hypothetical protein
MVGVDLCRGLGNMPSKAFLIRRRSWIESPFLWTAEIPDFFSTRAIVVEKC